MEGSVEGFAERPVAEPVGGGGGPWRDGTDMTRDACCEASLTLCTAAFRPLR